MDSDPEANQVASQILKTAFLSVVFSSCYYQTKTTPPLFPNQNILIKPPVINKVQAVIKKKKRKTIYLTFDDGPNKGTRKVMHIAEEEDVPISMFIVGEHVYGSAFQRETWDSILQCDQIEICNHSFTHAHNHYEKFYINSDSVVNDFTRCKDSLGLKNSIARTPGRNIWRTDSTNSTDIKSTVATADSLKNNGYKLIGWDLEWHYDSDLHLKNCADTLLKQIDSVFKKGRTKRIDHLVLLAHDQVYANADDSFQLRILINKLKNDTSYNLEFISNYPGIKKN